MASLSFRPVRVGAGVLSALVLAGLATDSARGAGPGPIAWREDLNRGLREARERNVLVWVQFTGPWCPGCHRMEGETFVHLRVVASSREQFVPVLLRTDLHEDLVGHFGLEGIPATVILKPSGEVVAKHEGFVEPDTFLSFLGDSLSRAGHARHVAASSGRARVGAAKATDGAAEVSLAGYCPVSLVRDRRLVPGQPGHRLKHDGREYRFADALTREMFRDQPERFLPVNAGRCPVRRVDRGDSVAGVPRWGVVYQGHLYLCADGPGRDRFLKNPERYAYVDAAERVSCAHCWNRVGLEDRGPRLSIARAQTIPSLPSLVPIEAFRLPTDRALR